MFNCLLNRLPVPDGRHLVPPGQLLTKGHLVLDQLDGGQELLLGQRHVQLVLEALVEDGGALQHRRPRPLQPPIPAAAGMQLAAAVALSPAVELPLVRP